MRHDTAEAGGVVAGEDDVVEMAGQSVVPPPPVYPEDDKVERAAEVAQQQRVHAAVRRVQLGLTQVCLLILTILAVLYTLRFAASIVLPMVLAMVTNLMLGTPMRVITRWTRLPRMIVAFFMILLTFCLIVAVCAAVSVPAAGWLARAPEGLVAAEQKLAVLRMPIRLAENAALRMQTLLGGGHVQSAAAPASPGLSQFGSSLLLGTRAFMGQMFTFFVMLFFLLAQGDSLMRRFVEIMPTFADKRRAIQIASHVERNISLYLATITMMNALVGLANFAQCWLVGMPNPFLWGVVAFALNYIPIIGPLSGMVIYLFVGLFAFPTALHALVAPAVYLGIHLLEGETITPLLLAKRFTLNPVLVMASLMFWDWMWGIAGAFLSVPMLAVLKIVCDHVDALTPIGHILGGPGRRLRR
ncbi:AI-2E family transporter [Acetobacter sacchari]|nr:AI-2E family transporter [Acetobacter sacchari]